MASGGQRLLALKHGRHVLVEMLLILWHVHHVVVALRLELLHRHLLRKVAERRLARHGPPLLVWHEIIIVPVITTTKKM